MKYKVEILPAAWEDLKRIEDFPESGSRIPDDWLNDQGYSIEDFRN